MATQIEYYITGYEYYTRNQLPEHYPLSIYDTQRFLENNKNLIENHTFGKTIYYRKFDLDQYFRIEKLHKIRAKIMQKVNAIK